jgi:hypothetical protein
VYGEEAGEQTPLLSVVELLVLTSVGGGDSLLPQLPLLQPPTEPAAQTDDSHGKADSKEMEH